MQAKVHFRGPILFVYKNDNLIDVRIPDCRAGGTHVDGSHAEAHWVGLLHLRGGLPIPAPVVVLQSHLEISAKGATASAKLVGDFSTKVSFNKLVSAQGANGKGVKLGQRNAVGVHTVIDIRGGTIDARNHTDPVEIPYQLGSDMKTAGIPLVTTWTGDTPVVIKGLATDVILNDGDELFIYNWERTPIDRTELESPMNSATTAMRDEDDFKWLYLLLETPSGLRHWLSAIGKATLPAPHSTINSMAATVAVSAPMAPPFFPPNSACDGGSWEEPPI
jgi:hypothetical protein